MGVLRPINHHATDFVHGALLAEINGYVEANRVCSIRAEEEAARDKVCSHGSVELQYLGLLHQYCI